MKLRTALLGAVTTCAFAPMAMAERGADGHVNVMYYQAPSIMNPYMSGGTKDIEAGSLVLEPLARHDPRGNMVPALAAEIPTVANGGISEDLKTITWKLKSGVKWSDGSDFTADDVVFSWEYCTHPKGGCAQSPNFVGVEKVEALDPTTIKITFTDPKPYPYLPFVGYKSVVIQKKQFENCLGEKTATCTQENFYPIGTGGFVVTDFKTNDVIQLKANEHYRDPAKPRFATMTVKGGGDAEGAGRAVLETGEFDYAWNVQVPPEVLQQMLTAGKGKAVTAFGTLVERIMVNLTDPSPSLPEGERSTPKHPHPILSDIKVRHALSKAIDRELLVEIGYGQAGRPTCDLVPGPETYAAKNTSCFAQDIEGAKALLEEAGWKVGADGVREKDGKKLQILYQTSTNAIRQDFQSLIKDWWTEIGVQTELKNVAASVFFGSDPGSPDTLVKFYADVEMYANNFDGTDPESYLAEYRCSEIPGPDSQWQGSNTNRVCDPAYEDKLAELGRTADPAKRKEIAIWLNNYLTVDNHIIIGLVDRGTIAAHSNTLGGVDLNTMDSSTWNTVDWYRIK